MPINYRIDSEQKIVWTKASGVLTDQELLEHKRRLAQDPNFKSGMRELSDVSEIEKLEVTPEGITRFVMQDKADVMSLGDFKLAIVASADEVFGMARMYQIFTEKNIPRIGVFRDLEEARAWLEIESPPLLEPGLKQ